MDKQESIATLKAEIKTLTHLLNAAEKAIIDVRSGDAKALLRYLGVLRRTDGIKENESLEEQFSGDRYFERYVAKLRSDTKARQAAKLAPAA